MSATTTPACLLGLTPDDLSAWRDRAFGADEELRVTAHVSGCPACQEVIAEHGALAAGLRAEGTPAPDPRNWARVQARITAGLTTAREAGLASAPRWRRTAIWSGLSAAAAAVIISALFFSLFNQLGGRRTTIGPLATATATPTIAPVATIAPTTPVRGAQLIWRTHAVPAATAPTPGNASPSNAFAFAPSDARTAYICAPHNPIIWAGLELSNHIDIWATHDGAQSWKRMATLSSPTRTSQCAITVDVRDALRLNVLIADSASYLSEDGGTTWLALSDSVSLYWLTTRGQSSVAVIAQADIQGYLPTPARAPRLVVSQNGFRSWTPIDTSLVAHGLQVWGVWQRPGDGALLALAEKRAPNPNGGTRPLVTYSLWQSADMGGTWKAIPAPSNLGGEPGFIVAQPRGSDPWRVCGLTYPQGNDYLGEIIACTLDGGKTWTPRPLTTLRVNCGNYCTQLETVDASATLLDNGTLLESFVTGPSSNGVIQDPQTMKLFALPAGSNQWEDLGPIPGESFLAIDAAGSVTVVGYSGETFIGVIGGALHNQVESGVNYTGDLSLATLP
jgi:hypothetical protein